MYIYIYIYTFFSTLKPYGTIGPARTQTLKIITIYTDTTFDTLIYTLCGEISKKSPRKYDVRSRHRRRVGGAAMTLDGSFFDAPVPGRRYKIYYYIPRTRVVCDRCPGHLVRKGGGWWLK